jgi:hypothetical protein
MNVLENSFNEFRLSLLELLGLGVGKCLDCLARCSSLKVVELKVSLSFIGQFATWQLTLREGKQNETQSFLKI